jgi:periplasmic divalent cation tolerance protein
MESQFSIVYCTYPDLEQAEKAASQIVEKKLAACVSIVSNVKSVYMWEGKLHKDSEVLLMMKTHNVKLEKLEEFVLDIHPFDVPEFLVVDVRHGSFEYLRWVENNILGS